MRERKGTKGGNYGPCDSASPPRSLRASQGGMEGTAPPGWQRCHSRRPPPLWEPCLWMGSSATRNKPHGVCSELKPLDIPSGAAGSLRVSLQVREEVTVISACGKEHLQELCEYCSRTSQQHNERFSECKNPKSEPHQNSTDKQQRMLELFHTHRTAICSKHLEPR